SLAVPINALPKSDNLRWKAWPRPEVFGPALQLRLAQNDKHPTASLWLSATLPTTSFAHLILKPHRNWPGLATCRDLPVITAFRPGGDLAACAPKQCDPICYLFATLRETVLFSST